jgi:hypothetical protein
VNFAKIQERLGFCPDWSLEAGIAQIKAAIESGAVENYRDARYNNYHFLRALLATDAAPFTTWERLSDRPMRETTAA